MKVEVARDPFVIKTQVYEPVTSSLKSWVSLGLDETNESVVKFLMVLKEPLEKVGEGNNPTNQFVS